MTGILFLVIVIGTTIATGAARTKAAPVPTHGRRTVWVLSHLGVPKSCTADEAVRARWLTMMDERRAPRGQLLSSEWTLMELLWDD